MAVSAVITPGKIFTDGEAVTVSELNKLGAPTVDISGAVGALSLSDGSVTNAKVAAGTGLQLDKLETGTDAQVVVANSSGEGVWVAVSGDATVDNAGAVTVSSLTDGATAATQTASDNSTKVATTAYVDALASIPAGCITQYGGSAAPSGWLLCDGSVKNSDTDTTLAALYTAIGFTYGGTGSDAFNLPDLQGNVPVGKAASGTFDTLNNSGGTETHPLTESEMPAHSHTTTIKLYGGTSSNATVIDQSPTSNSPGNVTLTTSTAGSSSAHTNVQPYLVVNYIIKT